MIKRSKLVEAGLFDEKITQYGGEDTDLSAKIWDKHRRGFIFSKKSNKNHRSGKKTSILFCFNLSFF